MNELKKFTALLGTSGSSESYVAESIGRLKLDQRDKILGFASCLQDEGYKASVLVNPHLFTEILGLVRESGWTSPAELNKHLDAKSTPQRVGRWFPPPSGSNQEDKKVIIPRPQTIVQVIDALAGILVNKAENINQGVDKLNINQSDSSTTAVVNTVNTS